MRLKFAQQGSKENIARTHTRQQASSAARVPEPRGIAASLLNLQRAHGNRFVQRLLAEHRQAQEEEKTPVTPDVAERIAASRSSGQPLPPGLRTEMQTFLGQDLSGVRIHTSPGANQLARDVRAEAFTAENDVFFREGAYSPSSAEGRLLLVHELTHVVQQVPSGSPSFGAEADRCADRQNAPTISRKAERVSFGEREGTTLTATPKGEVAEERGGTVKEIDEVRATLEEVFRARIPSMTNAEIIQEALRLDTKLWKPNNEVGPRQKSAIAETLTEMYKTLSTRIKAAPRDNKGLPVVEGVKWDESSPLVGEVLDILPFGNLDQWRTFVLEPQASPERPRRRSRKRAPKTEYIHFEGAEEIVVEREGKTQVMSEEELRRLGLPPHRRNLPWGKSWR